ncbi:MAG TPA: fibronectin type III domain-containing protein [Nocardioidaceae bacterium]|nr:fibronectin type III domain-containing protein [Nocardioidaceae bacterium]
MLKTMMAGVSVGAMVAATMLPAVSADAALVTPRGVHTIGRTPTALSVDWRPVTGARAYRLQVSPEPTMRPATLVDVTRTHGVIRGLEPMTRYYYRVSALDPRTGKRIGRYTPKIRTAMTRSVRTPTGLGVVDRSETSVSLTWTAPTGATYYRVATSTSSSFSDSVYTQVTGPAATIAGLSPDTTYHFRVQVVRSNGSVLTPFSLADSGRTAPSLPDTFPSDGPVDLRVGSFNVMTVGGDVVEGNRRPWKERRQTVIRQILGEKVDVLGVQEANQSYVYRDQMVDGENQITDLKNGLNKAGGSYAVANETPYNCVNPGSSYNCVYKYRGASGGNRIYYNTETVDLVSEGSYEYRAQSKIKYPLSYAVLQVKKTGDRFFFASVHLEPADRQVRIAQWHELIAKVNALKGSLPVVVVGDFNTQKMDPIIAPMLTAMKSSGYGDVLNQVFQENPIAHPRAERSINGWINSANHLDRDVRNWSYDEKRTKAGITIDWIFASNRLPVREYKLVLDYDPSTLQVRGVFPSDHNMIRATLTFP